MTRWLLVALAACSGKRSPPPPPAPTPVAKPDASVAIPRPTMKSSTPIDLPDVAITGLQLVPIVAMDAQGSASAEKGVFDIRWREDRRHDAGIVCRIESYNLAYFGHPDLNEDAKPDEHEVLYRPDPFVLDPKLCEVRFLDARRTPVARACYQDGTMTAGPCPPGTFPPPRLPADLAVDVQGASAHRNGDLGLQVKALFTLGRPLADKVSFAIRCDGVDSEPQPGEGFVPLSRLLAGETLYTWELVFTMKKPLAADPKQCELRVFTKARTLGTFCIAEGSTEPGACGT